jgi:hypothetical protein
MSEMLELPKFASEAEEAQWWYDHREERAEAFVKASLEGRVTQGAMMRRGIVRTPSVMVSHEDYAVAKRLAEKKGVPHEAYLKGLVHEALEREQQLVG